MNNQQLKLKSRQKENEQKRQELFDSLTNKPMSQIKRTLIRDLPFSTRAYEAIATITVCSACHQSWKEPTVGDLCKMTVYDLFSIKNVGRKTVIEICNTLVLLGIELEDGQPIKKHVPMLERLNEKTNKSNESSEVRQNENVLPIKSISVTVQRKTLEEVQAILKEIKAQDKGRLNEVSRSIACRVNRENLQTVLKKVNNLLE